VDTGSTSRHDSTAGAARQEGSEGPASATNSSPVH
jgi:hypothetical protein